MRTRLSNVEIVGDYGHPSLEKILMLKPDLILGLTELENVYPQLSQIAPTVLFEFESSEQWKDLLFQSANVLGRADMANQLMQDYHDRLNDFKARIGRRFKELEVAIVRIYLNTIALYTSKSFAGSIVEDAGLTHPSVNNQLGQFGFSKESLQIVDGDIIFLWASELERDQRELQTKIAQLESDPLWQQLNVVQRGRVYEVPSYWIGSSILSANAVIDDLFKYLVAE